MRKLGHEPPNDVRELREQVKYMRLQKQWLKLKRFIEQKYPDKRSRSKDSQVEQGSVHKRDYESFNEFSVAKLPGTIRSTSKDGLS